MKIAIVTPFGAEERLDHFAEFLLAQGLIGQGTDVRLYTYRIRSNPAYANDGTYKTVPVVRCAQYVGFSPWVFWSLIRFRPKIVVLCHIRSFLSWPAYLAARCIGAKVVFQVVGFLHDPWVVEDRDNPLETVRASVNFISTMGGFLVCAVHGSFLSCWENYVTHMPLVRADARVTITKFEQMMLKRLAGIDSIVIPWGIPPASEHIPEREPTFQDGGHCPASFLLFIGQVKRRKGWDTIVEALAILKRDGIRKDLIFVTSSSPAEYHEATELVHRLELDDRVHFLFNISNEERAWLLHRAMATLAPSRYEGFGLTVFESWVEGVPVLGTDIPVYSDFLLDGDTGLVSKKGDPESLASNLKRLEEPGMHERLVAGGRRMALRYSDQAIVDNFVRLFSSLA